MALRLAPFVLLGLLVASCDGYNPDLGETPFRCGTDEPRCPDGYEPESAAAPVNCVCRRAGGGGGGSMVDAMGGSFQCHDDSATTGDPGGNETPESATPTTIGTGSTTAVFPNMSICPGTDVDVYSVQLAGGRAFQARISFSDLQGLLQIDLLNLQSSTVATGTNTPNEATVTYTPQTSGTYFVRVKSMGGAQNNYSLQMAAQ